MLSLPRRMARKMLTVLAVEQHNIVVIGGSAGSRQPLRRILADLPPDVPTAIFVVIHSWPDAPAVLAPSLDGTVRLRVRNAQDGDRIVDGTVLIAPPDRHLIVKSGVVRLIDGQRENLWRPAIDVLFRSAAVAYGARVIGVILSGALDDGSAGVRAIKRCGGTAIVQSPGDAQLADMPRSAVRSGDVDYVVPHQDIAGAIQSALARVPRAPVVVPDDLAMEVGFAETTLEEGRVHEEDGTGIVDHALWAAVRQFEQRAGLYTALAGEHASRGYHRAASIYSQRAREAHSHARHMRKLLAAPHNRIAKSGPGIADEFLDNR